MTIDESFNSVIDRTLGGIMMHAQLYNYFNFLGLEGYAECQKYRYYDESNHYVKLCEYFVKHCNKIPAENKINNQSIVPADWKMHMRFDVDASIRKSSIKTGIEKWVQWERDTKAFFEQCYQNLINLNEIAVAEKIKECICHVDNELSKAEQKMIELKAIDFNISDIIMEQEEEGLKYKKKIKEIKL